MLDKSQVYALMAAITGSFTHAMLSEVRGWRPLLLTAFAGAGFATFVVPGLAEKAGVVSPYIIGALSWLGGLTGTSISKALLIYLDRNGVALIGTFIRRKTDQTEK